MWPNLKSVARSVILLTNRRPAATLILRVGTTRFVAGGLEATLRKHGITSECAPTGGEAIEFLRLYDYDLVLMDLQLTDVAAHQLVRIMRGASFPVPVLVVAQTASPKACVQVLDQGADDVLAMPATARSCWPASAPSSAAARATPSPSSLWLDRRDVRAARRVAASVAAGICRAGVSVPPPGQCAKQESLPDASLLRH
jgi:CheY-like chemotaxis protein